MRARADAHMADARHSQRLLDATAHVATAETLYRSADRWERVALRLAEMAPLLDQGNR